LNPVASMVYDTTLVSVLLRTGSLLIPPPAMDRMRAVSLAAFAQPSDPNLVLDHHAYLAHFGESPSASLARH
jgi:hypothetical protein